MQIVSYSINRNYHIVQEEREMCDWVDRELLHALLAPEDDDLHRGEVGVALDDASDVEVTPVPHIMLHTGSRMASRSPA